MIKIQQLKLVPGQAEEALLTQAAKLLRIPKTEILSLSIAKKSLDARKKPELYYLYTVLVNVKKEAELLKKCKSNQVSKFEENAYHFPVQTPETLIVCNTSEECVGEQVREHTGKQVLRPVIVGMGPAGLFCGYFLAKAGFCPLILERGKAVEERTKDVEHFWETGMLLPESNVQFGEGGAGTFSDGKLNTLVKDKYGRNKEVLRIFVEMGAPEEILYDNKPHIGTDVLKNVVKNMRLEIEKLGGEVRFESKLTDLFIVNNKLSQIEINHKEILDCRTLVLAVGHSARDTFSMLFDKKLHMEPKPFAVGVRIEHEQEMINLSQYGSLYSDVLPAAAYKVAEKAGDGRGVYSFCMCPGGYVVNASSEAGRLCVNGMSYSGRDSKNANAAMIVTIDPADYGDGHALSGVEFQRKLEEKAYRLAGGRIPVQTYESFKACVENLNEDVNQEKSACEASDTQGRNTANTVEVGTTAGRSVFLPAMKGAYEWADVSSIFPDFVAKGIVDGIEKSATKIKGFNSPDALLSGVESRTSSPLRIVRDDLNLQADVLGIYPCGEGAGYAGGITSAAMDGIKVAEAVASKMIDE